LAEEFVRKGWDVEILSDPRKVRTMALYLGINLKPRMRIHCFRPFGNSDRPGGYKFLLSKKLCNILDSCEAILCDNFCEILETHPHAILLANFFWHEDNPETVIRAKLRSLLNRHQPVIFADQFFAARYIQKRKYHIPVGPFRRKIKSKKTSPKVFLTPGSTKEARETFEQLKKLLQKSLRTKNKILHPQLHGKKGKDSFFFAKRYQGLPDGTTVCVCRPGLGTLTECFERQVLPVCLFERNNLEMKRNHQVLLKAGLSFCRSSRPKQVFRYLGNRWTKDYEKMKKNLKEKILSLPLGQETIVEKIQTKFS